MHGVCGGKAWRSLCGGVEGGEGSEEVGPTSLRQRGVGYNLRAANS